MKIDYLTYIQNELNVEEEAIDNIIALVNDGNTIPFIARYRKEKHGNLDEVAILNVKNLYDDYQKLSKRQEYILGVIKKQGKLTQELRAQINSCFDENRLEDFYLPYKKKRKTKADKAISHGLESLKDSLLEGIEENEDEYIKEFLRVRNIKLDVEEAKQLCIALFAMSLNENSDTRKWARDVFKEHAKFKAHVKKDKENEGDVYKDYFNYEQKWDHLPAHRALAMLRAENEGILTVKLRPDRDTTISQFQNKVAEERDLNDFVKEAVSYAYKKHLEPSLEKEFISKLRDRVQHESAETYAENLKALLLSPPIREKALIAIDPGIKSGHKMVALSPQGELKEYENVRFDSKKNESEMKKSIENLIDSYNIEAIAIGNGTGGREAYNWLSENFDLEIFLVDESGASVYSASEIAREEFPELDLTFRGAISIGRRLQNPLAELIKIDPKSLGIGQYHHDIPVKILRKKLKEVIELCVNKVGAELNTSSHSLLQHISGIGPSLAEKIIDYRQDNGKFNTRKQLKKVSGIGSKSFKQAAGFLRINNGDNPLDSTNIHPESYKKVKAISKSLEVSIEDLFKEVNNIEFEKFKQHASDSIGESTLRDIYEELQNPGRDFRETAKPIHFDENVKDISDLKKGMKLNGIVANITDFGAFIDIGIKENGLLHKSEITEKFVMSPFDELDLMQHVQVTVIDVDEERERITLSMRR